MNLDVIENSSIAKIGKLPVDAELDSAVHFIRGNMVGEFERLYIRHDQDEATGIPTGDFLNAVRIIDRTVSSYVARHAVVQGAMVSFFDLGSRHRLGEVGEWHTDGLRRAITVLGGVADFQAAQGYIPKGDGLPGTLNYKPSPSQIVNLDQAEVAIIDGETVHRRGPLKTHGWSIVVETMIRGF